MIRHGAGFKPWLCCRLGWMWCRIQGWDVGTVKCPWAVGAGAEAERADAKPVDGSSQSSILYFSGDFSSSRQSPHTT